MSTLEHELVEKISHLSADQQRKVLEFVRGLEAKPVRSYSARELMKFPPEERERLVKEAIERSANVDFEIFEAYSEEDFDDPS
jgi:hypothetical protein